MSPAQPRRLLFVVNASWFFVSHRLPIAQAAIARGYEVHLAATPDPSVAAVREAGVHFHPLELQRKGVSPRRELIAMASLARLYRRLEPDIVHHVTIKPVIYGGIAARLTRVPCAVHAIAGMGYLFVRSGPRGAVVRRLMTAVYRLAFGHPHQRVIVQNSDDYTLLTSSGAVRPDECLLVHGSGVDLALFTPPAARNGSAPVRVVFAARMLRDKGLGEFVRAARMLRAEGANAHFVLAGDVDEGNPASVSPATLRAWHDEGVVEWLGFQPDMPRIFREADIACLPSYREGMPRVLLEAAAAGLPVVTTDVPGCREAIQPGVTGFLVPARNAEALAAALRRLIEDPELRGRMGAAGRALAERDFSLDSVVQATLSIYDELIENL